MIFGKGAKYNAYPVNSIRILKLLSIPCSYRLLRLKRSSDAIRVDFRFRICIALAGYLPNEKNVQNMKSKTSWAVLALIYQNKTKTFQISAMKYGRKCLVCKNTRHREHGLRLFRFPPRDSSLWPRWLKACGLTEADIDLNSREPPRLCHRHFQQKDFLTRKLTGTAVPSLFPVEVLTEVTLGSTSPDDGGEEEEDESQVTEQQQVIEEVVYEADVHPDQLIEFNESIEDFLDDVDDSVNVTPAEEVDFVESSEQILEQTVGDTVEELVSPEKVCNDDNHIKLLEELNAERAKVEKLEQELLEKDKKINDQQELLAQLGVQLVTYND